MYIKFLSYILLLRITQCTEKIIGIISVDFDVIDQLLIYILHFSSTWEKIGVQKASASPIYKIQESLYLIYWWGRSYIVSSLISVSVWKLATLTKVCLNETCNRVRVGRYVSDTFPVKNGWKKKEMSYRHCFSSLFIRRI